MKPCLKFKQRETCTSTIKLVLFIVSLFLFVVTAQSDTSELESQLINEMDILYSELLQIEESIGKSLRKLQLLKKIQNNKISIPATRATIETETKSTQTPNKTITEEVKYHEEASYEMLFDEDSSMEELAIANSFVEKTIFESKNTSIVKFSYMSTPYFIDSENSTTSKVLLGMHSDLTLGIYSLSSGAMLGNLPVINETEKDKWYDNIVDISSESRENAMVVCIFNTHGDSYIIDLGLEKVSINIITLIDKHRKRRENEAYIKQASQN